MCCCCCHHKQPSIYQQIESQLAPLRHQIQDLEVELNAHRAANTRAHSELASMIRDEVDRHVAKEHR